MPVTAPAAVPPFGSPGQADLFLTVFLTREAKVKCKCHSWPLTPPIGHPHLVVVSVLLLLKGVIRQVLH